MFDSMSQTLQEARDEMPPAASLTDGQRASLMQTFSDVRNAVQRLREEVSSVIR